MTSVMGRSLIVAASLLRMRSASAFQPSTSSMARATFRSSSAVSSSSQLLPPAASSVAFLSSSPHYNAPTPGATPRPGIAAATGAVTPAGSSTRLYHSNRRGGDDYNDYDNEGSGILSKLKGAAKKFLPTKWFQSDEERRKEEQRSAMAKSVKSDIRQVFKDAPLPIRMLGGAIAPLLGGMLSSIAEVAASQQELVDDVIQQATNCIENDMDVVDALGGEPLTIGTPFSQSSSSSSINGITSTRVELAFPVVGRSGLQGVCQVTSVGQNNNQSPLLEQCQVQINGRVFPVSTTTIGGSSSRRRRQAKTMSSSRFGGDDDDDKIIEAEIIEKDTKRK